MAELPGRKAQPNLQAPKEGTGSKGASSDAVVVDAPTSSEVLQTHEQLNQEEQLVLQSKFEEMRQKRELELQKGKPKKIEQVNVGDLKFAIDEKKAGLPERIKKLPKDHPVRVLYEKGFNQKNQQHGKGTGIAYKKGLNRKAVKELSFLLAGIVLIVALVWGVYKLQQQYQADSEETKQLILTKIKEKNYTPEHPKLAKEFQALYWSKWLSDLKKLLDFIDGLGTNYEVFDGNPEPGSYTEYIKRHNKPFNQAEALEWYAREIRKPSWVQK